MIFFGTGSAEIAEEYISEPCSNCGAEKSVRLRVYQEYAHIFFIPLVPLSKIGLSRCLNCKQELEQNGFRRALFERYQELKSGLKTPLWTYSGFVVITVLIFAGIMQYNQSKDEYKELVKNPQKGDIYEVRIEQQFFTLYKVEDVMDETVFLLRNNYEADGISGLRLIKEKGDNVYNPDGFTMLKSELETMLEKGDIISVDRK